MGKFEKGKRPTQAQSYAEPQRAPKKKKQKKQSRLGLIVALLAAAVVLVGCGVGYMFLRDDGRIVNNLYVAGVDLSGMTKEEARAALEKGVSVYGKENMNVALYTRPYDTFTRRRSRSSTFSASLSMPPRRPRRRSRPRPRLRRRSR